jgi:hypothetical protein
MKISPASLAGLIIAIAAFLLVAVGSIIEQNRVGKRVQERFNELPPAGQQAIRDYESGISKARIGDFVTVRNLDRPELTETFIVTDRFYSGIHLTAQDPALVKDSLSAFGKPHTFEMNLMMRFETLRGREVVFLHQEKNPVGWRQMACWYYGLTQG